MAQLPVSRRCPQGFAFVLASVFFAAFALSAQTLSPHEVNLVVVRAVAAEPATPDGPGVPAELRLEVWPPAPTELPVALRVVPGPGAAAPADAAPQTHTTTPSPPRYGLEGLWHASVIGDPHRHYARIPAGARSLTLRVSLPYDELP